MNDLKLAIEALIQDEQRLDAALDVPIDKLRALLADDGAAALREHDERVKAEHGERIAKAIQDLRPVHVGASLRDFDRGMESAERIARDLTEFGED